MKVIVMSEAASPGAVDYSALTGQLGPVVTALVVAAAAVIAAGLGWLGVSWGFPKLLGLFKKTAK